MLLLTSRFAQKALQYLLIFDLKARTLTFFQTFQEQFPFRNSFVTSAFTHSSSLFFFRCFSSQVPSLLYYFSCHSVLVGCVCSVLPLQWLLQLYNKMPNVLHSSLQFISTYSPWPSWCSLKWQYLAWWWDLGIESLFQGCWFVYQTGLPLSLYIPGR